MVLVGLLVLALVCLGMGLILTSAPWLIGSLIASAGAGFLIWRTGSAMARQAKRSTLNGEHEAIAAESNDDDEAPAVADADDNVEDVAAQPAGASGDDVWVIDGRPRYHRADCAIIKGQDAEPIPFDQATEDGFMPCSLCEPNVERTSPTTPSSPASAN